MKYFILLFFMLTASESGFSQQNPDLLLLDYQQLLLNKTRISQKDTSLLKAFLLLKNRADKILEEGKTFSVMNKTVLPPSGNKHDYLSQAPYWWPDSTKANGKPYIRKDGQRNPEIYQITDHDQFDQLMADTEILALAYFYTENEAYAQFATKLLKVWFVDEATKMNPHLNFGQGIPGINTGRGIGIIETRNLPKLCDATVLLSKSKAWSFALQHTFKQWISKYNQWLIESDLGKDEADEHNNHGTYYSVQVVALSIFIGETKLAKSQIDTAKIRIQKQLKADGSQPFELARTLPFDYATMNLEGFCELARMAEKLKIDLWHFQTVDGKSIKEAIDWFLPFIENKKVWHFKQLKKPVKNHIYPILKMASSAYNHKEYDTIGNTYYKQEYREGFFQLKY